MATFTPAPDVERIGWGLVRKHHTHLELPGVRVDFLFRDDTPKKNGKAVWGTCRIIRSLAAYLAGDDETEELPATGHPFFVVTISLPIWETLHDAQKTALVDHELCHAWAEIEVNKAGEKELKLSVTPHDMEEFRDVVRRHGVEWRGDLAQFAETIMSVVQPALAI